MIYEDKDFLRREMLHMWHECRVQGLCKYEKCLVKVCHILTTFGWRHNQRRHGHQSKSPFPRFAHDTYVVFYWFITLQFVFQVPFLTLHSIYKYILIRNWFYIMYIIHSCPLLHKFFCFKRVKT